MRTAKTYLVSGIILCAGSLTACTTVDLSQVSMEAATSASVVAPQKNIVERACLSLGQTFRAKGWSHVDPNKTASTATSVLLNGRDASDTYESMTPVMSANLPNFLADVKNANHLVNQTTKAAEIYFSMADDNLELDAELSDLEVALLSARRAYNQFSKDADAFPVNQQTQNELDVMAHSIAGLKAITDQYGNRIRANIAARAAAKRS